MHIERHVVAITTAVGGAKTAYTTKLVNGRILAISYIKGDFDDGVDFTITTELTLQNLWVQSDVNATAMVYPFVRTNDQNGGGTTDPKYTRIVAARERVKIVIASGGDEKSGTFHVLVG